MSGNKYDLLGSAVIQSESRRLLQPSVNSINSLPVIIPDRETDLWRTVTDNSRTITDKQIFFRKRGMAVELQ